MKICTERASGIQSENKQPIRRLNTFNQATKSLKKPTHSRNDKSSFAYQNNGIDMLLPKSINFYKSGANKSEKSITDITRQSILSFHPSNSEAKGIDTFSQ
jgi:hypothetical protein